MAVGETDNRVIISFACNSDTAALLHTLYDILSFDFYGQGNVPYSVLTLASTLLDILRDRAEYVADVLEFHGAGYADSWRELAALRGSK